MGWKKMIFGEKMPDKHDPQYKERYEREVDAGRRFAKATRIDKAAAKVQGFANMHRTLFLIIVFSFVAACTTASRPSGQPPRCRTASFGRDTSNPNYIYNHLKRNDDEHTGQNQLQTAQVHAARHPLPAAARRVVLHL